ncbi:protein of unknown function [Cyanobium sp. NIES-981]|nr:protein of unknown function [Cyanobium sp. NIES-981]
MLNRSQLLEQAGKCATYCMHQISLHCIRLPMTIAIASLVKSLI